MEVIFLKNVERVGRMGEIRDVAEGYARNFLLPNKIAEPATAGAIKKMKERAIVKEQKQAKITKDADKLSGIIAKLTLTFAGKADGKGTFFAGISAEKIAATLKSKGYIVKPKQILIDGPLKKTGTHSVSVNFNGEKATMRVVLSNEPTK